MPASVVCDLNEVTRHEDRLCLRRHTAKRLLVCCSQIRSPVAGDVTRSDAPGSRKCKNANLAVPAEVASVGDELWCSAGVFLIQAVTSHFSQ